MSKPVQLGIIGWPVSHSLSPAMHEAAGSALGLPITYARHEIEPADLERGVRALVAAGLDGFNVTVPHKQAIMAMLDRVSDEARAIGAVNTVVCTGSSLVGHNTDARGLVRSLEESGVALAGSQVVVLGAGGAARAAVVGIDGAQARSIVVAARRHTQASELCETLAPHVQGSLVAADLGHVTFGEADLIVQATSATLSSNPTAGAFATSLPWSSLRSTASVVDLVYKPKITAVLEQAEARGAKIVDGLGMLIHQGALAFELWTGRQPPLDVMRKAIESQAI